MVVVLKNRLKKFGKRQGSINWKIWGNMVSGPGGKNGNNANGKKRERKEGDNTVISHKITDWGKYIIFFSPQLGQRK